MSYEGYEQCICQNGHYFINNDIYNNYNDDDTNPKCDTCDAPAVWINGVDDTNGYRHGYVPLELLRVHSSGVFIVPTKEDTDNLETYADYVSGELFFIKTQTKVIFPKYNFECTQDRDIQTHLSYCFGSGDSHTRFPQNNICSQGIYAKY